MSGGPAEAALISAAVGAGTSAIQGKDPFTGALVAGSMGALAPGLGSALGGKAAGTGATLVGEEGIKAAAQAAPTQLSSTLTSWVDDALAGIPQTVKAGTDGVPATMAGASADVTGVSGALASPGTPKVGSIFDVLSKPKGEEFANMEFKERLGNYLVQNPTQGALMLGGGANMLSGAFKPEGVKGEPISPEMRRAMDSLAYYKFDPRIYRPAYNKGGGITDLDVGNASRMPANPVIMMRSGGISNLGGYSDGGRLLRGPGDGVSDGIPAMIGRKQPARLADGEFVVPARIVSELGNGSTDAGARQLYAMMDRVQARRGKTMGKNRVAVNSRASKLLPA